ncbi:hypothetical protein F442_16407 [Phytophthora nicotianae P10297]|uniref:Uncharacterized protein n=1 Tax=Phytophthora nicotianae P10297 TaxID=1317064 RepID=W2YKP2_PHYNI|nr:hypothetical protein F442_16407 [Phytophthora nicotianae P10297]
MQAPHQASQTPGRVHQSGRRALESPRTQPRGCHPRVQAFLIQRTPRKQRRQTNTVSINRPSLQAGVQILGQGTSTTVRVQQQSASPPEAELHQEAPRLPNINILEAQVKQETGLRLYIMKNQKRKDVWHFARLIPDEMFDTLRDNDLTNEHGDLALCLCRRAKQIRCWKTQNGRAHASQASY